MRESETPMEESFESLFEESLTRQEMRIGEVITAEVVAITDNVVVVNAGLKSESYINIDEFRNDQNEIEVQVGDYISVAIEALEDGYGETRLSREKARRIAAWNELEKAMRTDAVVTGVVTGKVKGGLTVITDGIRAFLPGSLVDLRPVKDTSVYEGESFEFKVIKLDRKRNNVVLSRRAVLEEALGEERQVLLKTLTEGAVVKGVVKNITDYGAFVDLGGVDGLLHITDLAWRRIKHPSEILAVGDEVLAKVLKFDREKDRVSLGVKQLGKDPWLGLAKRYPPGLKKKGKVTNITDYGAFVEVEQGIEGLVHVSEMDWTNKNVHPSKIVQIGDEVEVVVLEIDESRRRISLGMKQCRANPWEQFSLQHKKGDEIVGQIKSITDFGIFIGLPGNIDGLVHASDISWTLPPEEAVRQYKKGQEVRILILSIDVERERISLGIKHLDKESNPALTSYEKGSQVSATVVSADADGVRMRLPGGGDAYLNAFDITLEETQSLSEVFEVDQEVLLYVIGKDTETGIVYLAPEARRENVANKQKDKEKESHVASERASGTTNLGVLLKAKLDENH